MPWQAVARDPSNLAKGFKTFDELAQADFFNQYVGDPDTHQEPTNPIMVESTEKRGVAATEPNGGDRTIGTPRDDLQFSCIFPLTTPVDDTIKGDCTASKNPAGDNPLCDDTTPTLQINAKAYPGLRELSVIHGLAGQGITASVCPANVNDTGADDYGYRPAIGSIIDRLKQVLGGTCLSRPLHADNDGNVPCIILEASHVDGSDGSQCDYPGRQPVDPTHKQAIAAAQADPFAPKDASNQPVWNNFCEITQLSDQTGDQRTKCQTLPDNDAGLNGVNGWCYLDAEVIPPVGDATLPNLANCPAGGRRIIRYVNSGAVQPGATAIITCSGDTAE